MNDEPVPIQAVERVEAGAYHSDGTPLDATLPVDYQSRFLKLTKNPNFIDTIFAHIANGGTMITLAQMWGVRYSDLSNYIGEHDELAKRYNQALIDRSEWETERLLQELRAIATVDIRQAYEPDGTLKDMKDIPENVAAAIAGVESEELFIGSGADREMVGYTKKVKFWDKAKAIEMFMKKHGMLVDRTRHEVGARLEDLVHAANDDEPIVIEGQLVAEKNSTESAEATPVSGVLKAENHSA